MVKAVETSLRELLEGTKQYQVPLYQRTYSWKTAQLERLWEDVVQLAEDRAAHGAHITHFLGSLVLAPTPDIGPAGVSKYLVVDGQQRLTTTTLLLAAIRDHRAATESPEHRERLNEQYLINKWKTGEERLKLLPTQADRPSYLACLESGPQAGAEDQVGAAYRYFRGRIADHDDPDDERDIERIEDAVLSGLTLVSVTTTREDNAHRIFESLNNTGLRLTQGDLLRNYLFMRLPHRGEVVYGTQWLPLQERLSNDELELLFWLDAVQRDESITQRDTYQAQVNRLDALPDEAAIEAEVYRFAGLSRLLATILDPSSERHAGIRERLDRLRSWGSTTAYPLLLHLLDRRSQGGASDEEVERALLLLESYLVRRVVTGRATAGLNRVLLRAVPEIAGRSPVDQALRSYLSTGRKFFATDDQVRLAARTVPFYFSGRTSQRKLVLAWLEKALASKEPADLTDATIEHVMPQTLTPAWRAMLEEGLAAGERVADVHDELLHTLGNLTLSAYNPELSNRAFSAKRTWYSGSGLQMNHEIAQRETWGKRDIEERAAQLAERIVSTWPGPDAGAQQEPMRAAWGLMNRALAELPPGSWTSYSAVAQLIGSHQVPVGQRIANHPVPNGHRVLQAGGTVSPGFRWLEGAGRSDTQREALEAEGLGFDSSGHADPERFVDARGLAALAGVDAPDEDVRRSASPDSSRETSFWTQLADRQDAATVAAVGELLQRWTALGGHLEFGTAPETSCFLTAGAERRPFRLAALYPSGRFEVQFQHLASRPPFDDLAVREELRRRLAVSRDIDLPTSRISLRPGFDLEVLQGADVLDGLAEAFGWFVGRVEAVAGADDPGPGDWFVSFGDGLGRSWEDARRYGFVSAGGGTWYSSTLRAVPVGARVFVHVAGRGYVGVGITVAAARRFDEAEVSTETGWRPLAALPLSAPYQHVEDPGQVTDENAEYVIPVRWLHAAGLDDAYWEPGMFANQHSACPLTHAFTFDRLRERFGLPAPEESIVTGARTEREGEA